MKKRPRVTKNDMRDLVSEIEAEYWGDYIEPLPDGWFQRIKWWCQKLELFPEDK